MSNQVRKGLVNHEVNREFYGFVTFESLMLVGLVTYFGVEWFNWNVIATLVIGLVVVFGLVLSPLYHALGLFFSLGWGYLGYKLFKWIITLTGGGEGLATTIGVIGFILIFLMTIGARIGGKEYLDDIGNK